MKLLPNETKLTSSNADKIILTDHRIQMTDSVWGQSFTIGIFLEDISSIEVKYKSNPFFIVLGILSVLTGVYLAGQQSDNGSMIGGFIFGVIFFIMWLFTRKHVVSISSNGGSSLNFVVQGMLNEEIYDFVYKVSVAKQKRVNHLHKI